MSIQAEHKPPAHYAERAKEGDETWLEDAIEDWLGITVSDAQKAICRSVVNNPKTIVVTANGLGKSYILAAITVVWNGVKYPAISFGTSGTYSKLKRTFCKPVEAFHNNALSGQGFPGRYKRQPPRIEIDGEPEHYFEAASPEDAGELEGVHSAYTLGIIEEADKDAIDAEVIDSMESLVTDHRDRLIAIANPPESEANIVYDLMNDRTWNLIQFSSFESHNVKVELGETEGEKIDGLASLEKIKDDWVSFNDRDWPGVEAAKNSVGDDTLDARWFRRRLGRIPPEGAGKHRPFARADVEAAFQRDVENTPSIPGGISLDVARRGGDSNAMFGVWGPELRELDHWNGVDHVTNKARVRENIGEGWDAMFPIDANGEGSGLADEVSQFYPDVHRFDAGGTAADETEYYDCWAEGLFLLGQFLRGGGSFSSRRLREELLAASRTVSYEEKYYSSRDSTVLKATSKDDVKEHLGRSPDFLDAAYMAIWAREASVRQPETYSFNLS